MEKKFSTPLLLKSHKKSPIIDGVAEAVKQGDGVIWGRGHSILLRVRAALFAPIAAMTTAFTDDVGQTFRLVQATG